LNGIDQAGAPRFQIETLTRYLRRDFALAVAMTANGGATVIRTRIITINKPNMIHLAFFGFSVEQNKDCAQ